MKKIINFIFWFLFASVSLYSLYLAFFYVDKYKIFIAEDGFIEYGSSLSWFVAAIFLLIFYLKNHHVRFRKRGLFHLALLMIFIVFCGEEISWGQRIFNLTTPEILSQINVQNEITLHNIGHISIFSNLFFIGNIVFFYFLKYFLSKGKFIKFEYDVIYPSKGSVVVFSLSLCVWLVVGIRFGTLGFHPYSFYAENYYTQMDDEIFEFLSAVSFLCYSLFDVLLGGKVVTNSSAPISIK